MRQSTFWVLLPRPAIQLASAGLRCPTAPLFEEEGYVEGTTVIPQPSGPRGGHGARARATFTSDNYPVETWLEWIQILQEGELADERLATQESDGCRNLKKLTDSVSHGLFFYRGTDPDVRRKPVRPEQVAVPLHESGCPRWPFGQDLVDVAVRPEHHLKASADEELRHLDVEQVRH